MGEIRREEKNHYACTDGTWEFVEHGGDELAISNNRAHKNV
jgi:hypothetical protein